jgi:hypothetical protein
MTTELTPDKQNYRIYTDNPNEEVVGVTYNATFYTDNGEYKVCTVIFKVKSTETPQ